MSEEEIRTRWKDVELMFSCRDHLNSLVHLPAQLPLSQFTVRVSNDFNRRFLSKEVEQNIEDIWQKRVKANPHLFNGWKFRLHSVEVLEPEDNVKENITGEGEKAMVGSHRKAGIVCFNLGFTNYKDFQGTNFSPKASVLRGAGLKTPEGNAQVFLSDALGVGALVHTEDALVVMMRRSHLCGEAQGLVDVPGGHAEPGRVFPGLASYDQCTPGNFPRDLVAKEVYQSALDEIVDETGVPASAMGELRLMGVARNKVSAGRPGAYFYTHCSLTGAQVEALYRQGKHQEAFETTEMLLLDVEDALMLENGSIWPDLSPSGQCCLLLYARSLGMI